MDRDATKVKANLMVAEAQLVGFLSTLIERHDVYSSSEAKDVMVSPEGEFFRDFNVLKGALAECIQIIKGGGSNGID